jgi:hypothetical protein
MRITEKMLEAQVQELNRITGSPESTYKKTAKRLVAQVGNYHISYAYGGVCLHRVQNNMGGVCDVLSCGHIPKRELFYRLQAYKSGLLE